MSATQEVWCHLLTHTYKSALFDSFPLKSLKNIQELKDAVKNRFFNDIEVMQLVVWRCPESPILDNIDDTVEQQVNRVIADKLRLKKLSPMQTLAGLTLVPDEVLIVQLPTQIWCLAFSRDYIGPAFPVFVDPADYAVVLQKEAKQRGGAAFKGIQPTDLTLWKLYKPRPSVEIQNPEFFKKLRLLHGKSEVTNENKNESAVQLGPDAQLGTSWPNGGIHVLVQVPEPRVAKRKADELDVDELEQRKCNPLATEAPSSNAKISAYIKLQMGPHAILDDHPPTDPYIPPIHLLYDGFGCFHDLFNQVKGEPEEINRFEMIKAVDEFAHAMIQRYTNEDARRDKGIPLLNAIFAARKERPFKIDLRPAAIGATRTDGHWDGPHLMALIIVEFKNWLSGITSLPEAEVVSYLAHSQKSAMGSAKDPKRFIGWRIPCVGIVVIGWEIRFYALLTLGDRFRCIPLTPSISCVAEASNGLERMALHRAFMAASVLLDRIYTYCESQSPLKFPGDIRSSYIPAISKLGTFAIKELVPWSKPQESRYLYIAGDDSNREILVKFTPTYSEELHRFCHEKGHAPALLACVVLPGGWYGIAMEYLKDIRPITLSPSLEKYRYVWEGDLRELTKSFHRRGLVHGDLRDANIVCNSEGKLWLIDFDWGGKEGEASYPTADLHKELISGRTSDSLAITASDGERVLEITLQKMKQNFEMEGL